MRLNRFIKSFNAVKTGYSYFSGRITGHSITSGMPVTAGIEISNHCNLRCPECHHGSGMITRPAGFMKIELFKKIIQEFRPYLYNINLYFQGEPMLHPGFFEFLEASHGIKVTVSTNGHFLDENSAEKIARSGLKIIIISLDGMDRETYSLYRKGGEFDKVINGIRNVSRAIRLTGSPLKLEIQFLVNRHNEKQIPSVRRFSKEVNARLKLKSIQIINDENIDYWLPNIEKYSRYRRSNGNYIIRNRFDNHCWRLYLNPVVTWDGKVVPCCFDKNADHIMGDLNESSFREIWHGNMYIDFRNSVLTNRESIGICRVCTSGLHGVRY